MNKVTTKAIIHNNHQVGTAFQFMEITKATMGDSVELLKLQRSAYQSEAQLHNDFQIPPLTQTLEELKDSFKNKIILKVVDDSKMLASGQVSCEGSTCFIGRMAVWPAHQGKGIGSILLNALESYFPDAKRASLFTGEKSTSNIAMYERRGYQQYDSKMLGKTTILFFERKLRDSA